MFNFFKQNKISGTKKIWNDLCELDVFLNNNLKNYIESQSSIEVSNWVFINKPLATIEKYRTDIKFELYDFAKNQIFVKTLQVDINKLLNILRSYIDARTNGEKSEEKILLIQYNLQIKNISSNYLKQLNQFRELAEKLTDEDFKINMN